MANRFPEEIRFRRSAIVAVALQGLAAFAVTLALVSKIGSGFGLIRPLALAIATAAAIAVAYPTISIVREAQGLRPALRRYLLLAILGGTSGGVMAAVTERLLVFW